MTDEVLASGTTIDRRAGVVLGVAHGLFSNGQSSRETIRMASMLSQALDLPASLDLQWGQLLLMGSLLHGRSIFGGREAKPDSINMHAVVALTDACADAVASHPSIEVAERLTLLAQESPSPTWLFVAACIAGACALSITFGKVHVAAMGCIAISAGVGGLLRRYLGRLGSGNVTQVFAAALFAGLVGSFSVRFGIDGALRLIAICPCMILVPGPHLINGCLDLLALRLPLGIARIVYGGLTLLGISAGLLLGLSFGGQLLWVHGPAVHDTFWADAAAAGIAAGSYGIYFSMPYRMLMWPVLFGVMAHSVHWMVPSFLGAGAASSAGAAGLAAGLALLPLSRHLRLPFAAIGFASVVSLMPGVLVFRLCSGLLQIQAAVATPSPQLIANTLSDGIAAVMVLLALVVGLSLPAHILDFFRKEPAGFR